MIRQRQDEWAAARGWTPSRRTPCPRSAAGRRCMAYRTYQRAWEPEYRPDCPCQRWARLLDHGRSWTTADGYRALTGEPYTAHADDVDAFAADCARIGLRVTCEPYSPWNPGQTVLLVVEQEPHR